MAISGPPIRPVISAQSFYKDPSSHCGQSKDRRDFCFPVFGRLDSEIIHTRSPIPACRKSHSNAKTVRFSDQCTKVSSLSPETSDIHRRRFSNNARPGILASGQSRQIDRTSELASRPESGISKAVSSDPWIDGSHHRGCGVRQVENETSATLPPSFLASEIPRSRGFDLSKQRPASPSVLVGRNGQPAEGCPPAKPFPRHYLHIRRLNGGLGSPCLRPSGSRSVGDRPEGQTYKLSGNDGSLQRLPAFPAPATGKDCGNSMRQFNSCLISEQTGGDKVTHPVHADMASAPVVPGTKNKNPSCASEGRAEFAGRFSQPSVCKPDGMASETRHCATGLQDPGETPHRSVRLSRESPTTSILHSSFLPPGIRGRCPGDELGRYIWLRLPTDIFDSTGTSKSGEPVMCSDSHSPKVAEEVLVSLDSPTVGRGANPPTKHSRPAVSKPRPAMASETRTIPVGGMEAKRQQLIREGLQEQVVDTIQNAIRPGTRKTYDEKWKKFSGWCSQRGIDPFSANLSSILEYLQVILEKFSSNTVALHKASISKFHNGFGGTPVGKHPRVVEFLKGAFNKKPPIRVILPSWDLSTVVNMLCAPPFVPLAEASLKNLTLKAAFLVAITSARRSSEIQALARVEPFLRMDRSGVTLRTVPGFLPKSARPGRLGEDIFLPSFTGQNKELCVKRVIKHYIKRTEHVIKRDENHLFVAFGGKSKGAPVSKRTIAGWIVSVIHQAYLRANKPLPSSKIRAHSTRAMASSLALFHRAAFEDILKAADWRRSTTFTKHYSLQLWKDRQGSFGRAVLEGSLKQ